MVFGQTFVPSVRPLLLLLPGVALFSIFKVLSSDFIGRGRPILNTYAAVISLAVMLILSITLIPKLGLTGAALASTASYCACCLVGLVTFWRVTGVHPVSVLRPRRSDWELYRRSLRRLAGRVDRGLF
jgi:O-antigen/teichoic acid export membrane protein